MDTSTLLHEFATLVVDSDSSAAGVSQERVWSMKVYLDDNRADDRLVQLLRKAGHDVQVPNDASLLGASDARHFEYAIVHGRAILTNDRDDFRDLHHLVLSAGGQHPGVLVVRFERDSRKDMRPGHIVAALKNVEQAGVSCANEIVVLNQWR